MSQRVRRLDWLLCESAESAPDAPAVSMAGREWSYLQIDQMADQMAAALAAAGVKAGDRVGIWIDKSPVAIAAMQGTLRLGAAYVPVDPTSPAPRAALILSNCEVAAVVTSAEREQSLKGTSAEDRTCLTAELSGDGLLISGQPVAEAPARRSEGGQDELAYILYTSGSTGTPKGVMVSHRAAMAFIDWAVELVDAGPSDRFSNHAPFHFDLSVLDVYAAFSGGGCLCLVPEGTAFAPVKLVEFLVGERITVWYSVPSALILMIEQGALMDVDPMPLRHLCFAGEPFPIPFVRRLRERWPDLPMHNLYGPTETNVCTAYTVAEIESDRTRPMPIGRAVSGDKVWAVDSDGQQVAVGEEGELICSGPTVMLGYWGMELQGDKPYATGDLVRRVDEQNYDYVGRRDHMLKVRGHRIEAGEVESCLLALDGVAEAAVVVGGEGLSAKLIAYMVHKGQQEGDKRPSIIKLKRHCASHLPRSMIIDSARWLDEMPRTANGKIDRRELKRMANEPPKGA